MAKRIKKSNIFIELPNKPDLSVELPKENVQDPIHILNKTAELATGGARMSVFGKLFLAIIVILLIMAFRSAYIGYRYVQKNKTEIQKNWKKYRCDPKVVPFAGWLVGPSSVSGVENMVECTAAWFWTYIYNFMQDVFGKHLTPIADTLHGLTNALQLNRIMINWKRTELYQAYQDIANMLMVAYQNIAAIFKAVWHELSLIFDAFEEGFNALMYGVFGLASAWNGSIGGVGRFFCFRKNTLLTLNDNSKVPIQLLKPGQYLSDNNKVLAVLKLDGSKADVYAYPVNNYHIFVSGKHLVKEDNKWIRVDQSSTAHMINEKEEFLYALVTEKGVIKIDNICFADWIECVKEKDLRQIRNLFLSHLNQKKIQNSTPAQRIWGVHPNTETTLRNGKNIKIKDLKIGDVLQKGGKVKGIVKMLPKKVWRNDYLTGTQDLFIKEDNQWITLSTSRNAEIMINNTIYYHLITEEEFLSFNQQTVTDYLQTHNDQINNLVDNNFMNRLE